MSVDMIDELEAKISDLKLENEELRAIIRDLQDKLDSYRYGD